MNTKVNIYRFPAMASYTFDIYADLDLPSSDIEEGEIIPDYEPNSRGYDCELANMSEDTATTTDDSELVIPQIDQCTMCGNYRLPKFRYCHTCMILYNRNWYNLCREAERDIGEIHEWEERHGYANALLLDKVILHNKYGNIEHVAVTRVCSIIAYQHLLPTHELMSSRVNSHKYAAELYLQAATNRATIWLEFVGSNILFCADDCAVRLSMFSSDIKPRTYAAIDKLRVT